MTAETIITLVLAVLASNGLWSYIQFKAQQRSTKKTVEQRLLLGIAFKEIVESCQHHLSVGHISHEEYKELNHYLFEPYREMGGNGTADRLIKEVEKLPIDKEVS